MICLEKLQKELCRLLDIDQSTLPSVQEILKREGYTGIQKGDEFIDLTTLNTKESTAKEALESTPEKTPESSAIAAFGENFSDFTGKGMRAVEKLMQEKHGQVAGAFWREELGDIDLVWGEVSGKGKKAKGYGLAKILEKHGDDFKTLGGVASGLSEIIEKGKIVKRKGRDEAYNIEYKGYIVGINKGFNKHGENKWIVTAFDDSESMAEKTAKTARTDDFTKEIDNLSLNSGGDSTTKSTPEASAKNEGEAGGDKNGNGGQTLFSTPHGGAGLVGGSAAGLEQDEQGNWHFDPVKFAAGFLAGAGGSKAAERVFRHKAPRTYAIKRMQNMQESYKPLSQNNPILFAKIMQKFEPKDFLKSKKDMDNLTKEVFNKELLKAIESAIKSGDIPTMPRAEFGSREEFANLFDNVTQGIGSLQTPIGTIQVKVSYAWNHFKNNTYNTDREAIKGGFFATFRYPLFVVEQIREGASKPSVYFYKPFYDEEKNLLNLFGIGVRGNLIEFKTYYLDKTESRLRQILKSEVKILYVKPL